MTRLRRSAAFSAILAVTVSIGLYGCDDEDEDAAASDEPVAVAPGVEYLSYETSTDSGTAVVHLLTVDLTVEGTGVDVLMPEQVPAVERPSTMAENAGAVAVVNGDFFNNDQNAHGKARHTNAPVGPVIMGGQDVKAAVPGSMRMGPGRGGLDLPGDDDVDFGANRTVLGITSAGTATISELTLEGRFITGGEVFALSGLNQYGIRSDSIGVYTAPWGVEPPRRAVCGDEEFRNGPCSGSVRQIHVVDGVVTEVSQGDVRDMCCLSDDYVLAPGEVVFLARDGKADDLAYVSIGDTVEWNAELVATGGTELDTAIGGYPLVIDGQALDGVDPGARDPRTIAGHNADGTELFLAVVEDAHLTELAEILVDQGAHGVVNLDGGGSSLLATAGPDGGITVRNDPTDPKPGENERPVANALAVFHDPSAPDEDPAPDADFAALAGSWAVVPESPGQFSRLTVDEAGYATYVTEGTTVDYWEGTVEVESDLDGPSPAFTVDFEPSANFQAENPTQTDRGFTMRFTVEPDGDSLTLHGDGYEYTYVRES